MATFTNQKTLYAAKLSDVKTVTNAIGEWEDVFQKMPPERKLNLIKSGKAPIIGLAYALYIKLHKLFGDINEDILIKEEVDKDKLIVKSTLSLKDDKKGIGDLHG